MRTQAAAVDHCNIKANKHFTADMPAVLRQLQLIETQRCENFAQSSLQFAALQMNLYQRALDTNWKDLVLVNTFNAAQDINAFVAFTSTGAKCPPPPLPTPDAILSFPATAPQHVAVAASSSASRMQKDTPAAADMSPSPAHPPPAERSSLQKPPPLPPKTAAVDGKVCRLAFHSSFMSFRLTLRPSLQTVLTRICCRAHGLQLHAAQLASDCIMRGDLAPLGVACTTDVGTVSVADAGQLEPMDFKLMVSMNVLSAARISQRELSGSRTLARHRPERRTARHAIWRCSVGRCSGERVACF